MKLATASQMKELDRQAIEEYGVSSLGLMERAARAVAEEVRGLLFGGLLFLGYFLLSLGMGNFGTFLGPMFFAFGLFAIGLALGRGSYAFLMRAMFDLPNDQILKNANGMSAMRGGRGWLPIVVHGVGFLFGFSFFPYTLIVIALFGISLPQYLICYLLNDPIQKNIISPWERMQAQKET